MCTYVEKTPSMLQDELTRVGFVFAVCHIDVKSISLKHKDTILMFRTSLENPQKHSFTVEMLCCG